MIDRFLKNRERYRWPAMMASGFIGFFLICITQFLPMVLEIQEMNQMTHVLLQRIRGGASGEHPPKLLIQENEILHERIEMLAARQNAESHLSDLVELFHVKARETQVRIGEIQPREKTIEGDVLILPLELTLRGRYADIGRFIRELESSASIIRIHSVNMKAEKMTSTSLHMDITAYVFYLRPSA